MKSTTFPPLLIIVTTVFWISGIECRKSTGPPCSAAEVSDYFVNPSAEGRAVPVTRSPPAVGAFENAVRSNHLQPDSGGIHGEWLTDSLGMSYKVGYLVPQTTGADTTYPLIIYLHGGIGTSRNDKGDSAFFMLRDLADTFKLFLASPSANRQAPWWSPEGLSRILQTLRFMTLRYPINPDKVFLAGVSDGATGCYAAANTIPGPFAGFIAVSGFGGMLGQFGMQPVPGNLRQRPIYNVNAGLDRIYPVDDVKAFVATLQSWGVPITATWYDAEEHGFDYKAKEMGTLANLIRTWSKPSSRAISWTFVPGFPNNPDNIVAWSYASINASANGFWRDDTLILQVKGLVSVDLSFPGAMVNKKITCRMLVDSDKEVRTVLAPEKNSWANTLLMMAHACFPVVGPAAVYTVKP